VQGGGWGAAPRTVRFSAPTNRATRRSQHCKSSQVAQRFPSNGGPGRAPAANRGRRALDPAPDAGIHVIFSCFDRAPTYSLALGRSIVYALIASKQVVERRASLREGIGAWGAAPSTVRFFARARDSPHRQTAEHTRASTAANQIVQRFAPQ